MNGQMEFILSRFTGGQIVLMAETPEGRVPIIFFGGVRDFAEFSRSMSALCEKIQVESVPEVFKRAFEYGR